MPAPSGRCVSLAGQFIQRRINVNCNMHLGAYCFVRFHYQATGQPHYFGTIGLHREILQGAHFGSAAGLQGLSKNASQLTVEIGVVTTAC
jgi:hypothetical protein